MRVPTPKKIAPSTFSIRLFFNDPTTGKRKSHIIIFQGSQPDANRVARQLVMLRRTGYADTSDPEELARAAINTVGRGAIVLSQKQLQKELADSEVFADYVERWLTTNRVTSKAAKTQKDYAYKLRHYACPYLGPIRLAEIKREDIEDLLNALAERELSSATRKGVLAVVAMLLQSVQKDRGIPNVARDMRVGAYEPPRAASMDVKQARAYRAALGTDNLDRALLTLLLTGARPGEVLGLKPEDLDLEGADPKIVIRRSISRSKDSANEKLTKSGRSRIIDISDMLRPALLQSLQELGGSQWLFHDETGLPYWHSTLRDRHFATLKASGISQHFRLYDLRHTHASLALLGNTPANVVSERLGHANVAFTMQVYAHALPPMRAAVPRLFDELLGADEEDE